MGYSIAVEHLLVKLAIGCADHAMDRVGVIRTAYCSCMRTPDGRFCAHAASCLCC